MFRLFALLCAIYLCVSERTHVRVKRYPTAVSGGRTSSIEDIKCSKPICTGPQTHGLGPVYCNGDILSTSWYYGLQAKCPGDILRYDPKTVLENFDRAKINSKADFLKFCAANFENDSYLDHVVPPDWTPLPPNIRTIKDENLQEFARRLNERWKHLGRSFKPDVAEHPEYYPVLYVNRTFIVPGGDFKIYFYWDTFWIVKGLLFSGMDYTVQGILENFAQVIAELGYIPNAGSINTFSRSQPPVFAQMVDEYITRANKSSKEVSLFIEALDAEFNWWLANRNVSVFDKDGNEHLLFRYKASSNCPRPESLKDDINNAVLSKRDNETVWRNIVSACESGWDFSTRWFSYSEPFKDQNPSNRITQLIPVDLNSFLCKNALIMANFYKKLKNYAMEELYRNRYDALVKAVHKILWNDTAGSWFDFDLESRKHRDRFYASNVFPFYARCILPSESATLASKMYSYLEKEDIFKYPGGIPVSTGPKGQQWDFPNGWPPIVHLFIQSLRAANHDRLATVAQQTAQKWITTNYRGLMAPAAGREAGMWEKYDVRYDDGTPGEGGEYPVQQGFGWTNGAALDLLLIYGDSLRAPQPVSKSESVESGLHSRVVLLTILFAVTVILSLVVGFWCQKKKRRLLSNLPEPSEHDILLDDESTD